MASRTPEDETKLLELRVAGLTWHAVEQQVKFVFAIDRKK
jgi:hypothetical protein